jgi:hypothetical protein
MLLQLLLLLMRLSNSAFPFSFFVALIILTLTR